ncbi:methyltransferase domain-containing protein [Desulfonatronovibrio magnus]|uniref:methyltransferase domain-containing protein n=1 Tax=Desulfonatronovibrio magnus TaxID=698827 RepID=UPI0005EAE44F|nr:methyltransferase domain-containing protein [Desulfonatronovibrio magnus]
MKTKILSFLKDPRLQEIEVDDPLYHEYCKEILFSKPYLKAVYTRWYEIILSQMINKNGIVLELGSGCGFFEEFFPDIILSDIMPVKNSSLSCDACKLPFKCNSIDSITMVNVFHHIPDVFVFLKQAVKCLRQHGQIIMVEPWVSPFSRVIYSSIHHEPFDPGSKTWEISKGGPLSGANQALPWIVFQRDRKKFESFFPELAIHKIIPELNFRYLLSGGLSFRCFFPFWTSSVFYALEKKVEKFLVQKLSLFACIVLQKR